MIGKPGPFQIIEALGTVDTPIDPPRRRYDCVHYDSCLEVAAAMNWDNFTCRGCSGEIDQQMLWRAHQAKKRDAVADSLCETLPEIGYVETESPDDPVAPNTLRIVAKR